MLTVIVIPTGHNDRNTELLESVVGAANDVVFLENGKLDFNTKVFTKWKLFLYEGEFLDEDLRKALPEYIQLGDEFDVFSIYKMSNTGFSICPRLFKGEIKIKSNSLSPDEEGIKYNTILDGFILGL
jgi:hypothetical protein